MNSRAYNLPFSQPARPKCFGFTAIAAWTLLACAALAPATDWPQWRGPNRDGVWAETGILESIPADGLKVRWRARIGNGYSGPAVADGRVFVNDYQPAARAERVLCFDATTGKPLWVRSYPCDYADMEYENGPRAAPTVHGGKVYTLGTKGHLFCLDAADGRVVWNKDLATEFNARIPQYGAAAAPLIEGNQLIVCAGGRPDATVIAFNRDTGEVAWKALGDRASYSSPIAVTAGGVRQVIVWTADSIASLDPATGNVLWQVPWKASFDPAQMVTTPVRHKDMLLFLGAWYRGSKMLKLDPDKPAASVLWETRKQPTTTISTPLFQDDRYFYAVEGDGSLCCLDATSGNQIWATRQATSERFGNVHMTPNGDRAFLFNQKGHLILARLTPQGYQELGRTLLVEPTAGYRPADPIAWAHPASANRHVFARNDRELVCASSSPNPSSTFSIFARFAGCGGTSGSR